MIGIDVLELDRMQKFVDDKKLLSSTFFESEIKYFNKFQNPLERITGCFCAKEAVIKALGCPDGVSVNDIEILHQDNGKPYAKLHGKAYLSDDKKMEISISHSKTIAIAICQII